MSASEKCVASIADYTGFHFHPCGRPAVSPCGKFCGIHDPERRAMRASKRGPTAFERDSARAKERDARIRAEGHRAGMLRAAEMCDYADEHTLAAAIRAAAGEGDPK